MNINRKIWMSCALALTAACGSNTSTDDAAINPGLDSGLPGTNDAAVTIDTGTTVVTDPYVWVSIQDTEQVACTTNGPGADIDAVGKMDATTAKVVAWGKSARFIKNPLGNACDNADCSGGNCKYAAISTTFSEAVLVARTEGAADATVSETADDTGYFSLNAGTLQLQLADATTGAVVPLKSGDWLVVYEVDQTYITSKAAYPGCKCAPEHYTVTIENATGTKMLELMPSRIDTTTNAACAVSTVDPHDGCGTTVYAVP